MVDKKGQMLAVTASQKAYSYTRKFGFNEALGRTRGGSHRSAIKPDLHSTLQIASMTPQSKAVVFTATLQKKIDMKDA
jgi:hypothetical protein